MFIYMAINNKHKPLLLHSIHHWLKQSSLEWLDW